VVARVAYNDEVTGSSPVTPTSPHLTSAYASSLPSSSPTDGELTDASRADLEAFVFDLLRRWSLATASTRYKQLQALYR
jgi:hypothetical protein